MAEPEEEVSDEVLLNELEDAGGPPYMSRGIKQVPVHRLFLPGDFKARTVSEPVIQLAKSIQTYGIINHPTVQLHQGKFRIIDGRSRVAAMVGVLKYEEIPCHVIECSEWYAKARELTENVIRRHDPGEQRSGLVDLVALEEARIEAGHPEIPRRHMGRTLTARGKARREVAAKMGIRPETIRKHEWMEKRRKEREESDAAGVPRPEQPEPKPKPKKLKLEPHAIIEEQYEPTIKTLGRELTQEEIKRVLSLQKRLESAISSLHNAQTVMSNILDPEAGYPISPGLIQRLREDIRTAKRNIQAAVPESVCPYCKQVSDLQASCGACFGTGLCGAGDIRNVPHEYLEENVVCVGGRPVPLDEYLAESLLKSSGEYPETEHDLGF